MEFLLIATAHFLALLSPGPDFFLIIQASLRLPLRCGLAICAGIAAANGLYLLCAVLGLEAVRDMTLLMAILRYGGSLYLLYIGILLLTAPRHSPGDTGGSPVLHHHPGRQFLVGFLAAILNPKNIIFYFSLFTAMVSHETAMTTRLLYAVWMTSVVLIWDCLIVLLVAKTRLHALLGSGVFYVEKTSGAALALLGIALPFT